MNELRIFKRFLKENHCIKQYYEDFNLDNKERLDIKEINRRLEYYIKQETKLKLEQLIGSYHIFNGWAVNELKKQYWLSYYYKLLDLHNILKKLSVDNYLIGIKNI